MSAESTAARGQTMPKTLRGQPARSLEPSSGRQCWMYWPLLSGGRARFDSLARNKQAKMSAKSIYLTVVLTLLAWFFTGAIAFVLAMRSKFIWPDIEDWVRPNPKGAFAAFLLLGFVGFMLLLPLFVLEQVFGCDIQDIID